MPYRVSPCALLAAPVGGIACYSVGTILAYVLIELPLHRRLPSFEFFGSPVFQLWFAVIGTISGLVVAMTIGLFQRRRTHAAVVGGVLALAIGLIGLIVGSNGVHPALAVGAAASVVLWHLIETGYDRWANRRN